MKKLYILLFSSILSLSLFAQSAPDFTLTDVDGVEYNLYEELASGKTVIIDFFGLTCGSCQTDMGYLEGIWQDYSADQGDVVVWAIETIGGTDGEVDDFVTVYGGTFPRFRLGENENLLDLYQVQMIPSYFVICENGYVKPTNIEDIPNYIDACTMLPIEEEVVEKKNQIKSIYSGSSYITVSFETVKVGEVNFELFDMLGNKLDSKSQYVSEGVHEIKFNRQGFNRGYYLIRMFKGKEFVETKRIVIY